MNDANATGVTARPRGSLIELTLYFLRLGTTGFGGPVALVGQMERDLVTEPRLADAEEMREAIAICQSLPGPLAIQVGIFISYLRWRLLGRLGRRLGVHPAELPDRRGTRRALRAFRRAVVDDRDLLRRLARR